MQGLPIPGVPHCRNYLSQNQDSLEKVVLDDLFDGKAEKRYLHAVASAYA